MRFNLAKSFNFGNVFKRYFEILYVDVLKCIRHYGKVKIGTISTT